MPLWVQQVRWHCKVCCFLLRPNLLSTGCLRQAKAVAKERAEVLRIVSQFYADGGYIPRVDHSVPPDVPYENYVYFRQLLAELA